MDGFGPIDEMLGILLERWEHRYAFHVDREQQLGAVHPRRHAGGSRGCPGRAYPRRVRIGPARGLRNHDTPAQAAALIEAVMARKQLCRVSKPEAESGGAPDCPADRS